jgi:outer membrane protein OmpA-like peptidoglycan-associated protein
MKLLDFPTHLVSGNDGWRTFFDSIKVGIYRDDLIVLVKAYQRERTTRREGKAAMKKMTMLGLIGLLVLAGCAAPQTKTGKGATYGAAGGAAAGAILGQIIGGDTEGTLIGAAAGAAVGGAAGAGVGHMMDKQEAEMRDALATSEAVAVKREGDLLALTLKGDVTFDVDSDVVRSGLYNELDRVANILVRYPQTTILVEGHTDSTGSEAYNQQLSERRAHSVKRLLVERGVEDYRISAVGYGESRPVATNDTAAGRQMNRRVEIRINPNAGAPKG